MPSIGVGMIGAGMVGQLCHLANYLKTPDCRVVALAELRPELGRQAAEKFGVPRVYQDHHE
jgi:predicted dehydrogenase